MAATSSRAYERSQRSQDKQLRKEAARLAEQLKGRRPVEPADVSLTEVDLRRGLVTASDGGVYPTFTFPNHAFDQYEFHTAIVYDLDGKQEIARINGPAAHEETPTAFADCVRAVERDLPAILNSYRYEQANTTTSDLGKKGAAVAVLERDGSLTVRLVHDGVASAAITVEGVGVPAPQRAVATAAADGRPDLEPLTGTRAAPSAGIDTDSPTAGI